MTTLYAAKAGSQVTSDLYTLDPSTGVPSSVGATGFAITGLAIDPSDNTTLFGATSPQSSANPTSLVTVNTSTGAGTLVGAFTSNHVVPDICFDSSGQLYGWDQTTKRLVLINKASGALTQTAASAAGFSTSGNGIDCDSTDVLFSCLDKSTGSLRTISRATGALTTVVALTEFGGLHNTPMVALSFSPAGVLYGILDAVSSRLVTLDDVTGVLTEVAAIGSGDWDALAWSRPFAGGDVTPPTLLSIAAVADTVTLTYDEPLQVSPGPSPSEFVVTANSVPLTVTASVVSGSTVVLTVSPRVFATQTVLVSYTA